MKKLVMLALVAVSFLATARTIQRDNPTPTCSPCPFVR
jgi:hypothetical protein